MSNLHFSTKERILAAAEELFAKHGFAEASLREVTRAAQVNLAAVNYHFGSKENLINEVFRRRLDELSGNRLHALESVRGGSDALDRTLEAFIQPALQLSRQQPGGASFIKLLARAYAEHHQSLRQFLSENYGNVLRTFAQALHTLLPQLNKETLYWRLDFISGALTYAMADFGAVKRPIGRSESDHQLLAAKEFISFAKAGLQAPTP